MAHAPDSPAESRRKWLPIAALMLLSLLWAADGLRSDLFPASATERPFHPLQSQALLLGVFSALSAFAAFARRTSRPTRALASRAAIVGIGLFTVPAVLAMLASKSLDDATQVAIFSLTPVFAIIFRPHLASGGEQLSEPRNGFLAAMIATAGTLLAFPIEVPHSYATAFAMLGPVVAAASVAAANCVAVQIARRGNSVTAFATVAAGSAACLLALMTLVFRQNEAVPLDPWALLRLISIGLLFWLMQHMGAVQMTTRFLIAPLLANLVGIAFLRPHLQLQASIGLILIGAATGRLLLAPAESAESVVTTLGVK